MSFLLAEDEHVSPWWIMLPYWSPHFGYLQISLVTTVGIRRRNVGLLPPCSEDRDLLCIKCYNKYFKLEISSLKCCTLILERNAFSFCLSLNILNEFDFVLPVTVFKYRSACFLKAATLLDNWGQQLDYLLHGAECEFSSFIPFVCSCFSGVCPETAFNYFI